MPIRACAICVRFTALSKALYQQNLADATVLEDLAEALKTAYARSRRQRVQHLDQEFQRVQGLVQQRDGVRRLVQEAHRQHGRDAHEGEEWGE